MMTNIYPRELVFWPINNERGHTGLFVTFNCIRKRIFQCNGVITFMPYSRPLFATGDFYALSYQTIVEKIPIIPMINDACVE